MATRITPRDLELFQALGRGPLTVGQILTLSHTFAVAFPSTRRLQRRLRTLANARLLRQWWYATEGPGRSAYYTLSSTGSRLVTGSMDGPSGAGGPIGISRQRHTRSLMDFLVHTFCGLHRSGFALEDFAGENTLALQAAGRALYPDAAFTIEAPGRPRLRYFVELDTGTEPVLSASARDSWQRKLACYATLRETSGFRVLAVATQGKSRIAHIAAAAAKTGQQRPFFYGVCLGEYLEASDPIEGACFRDAGNQFVPLVPAVRKFMRPAATGVIVGGSC